ncbi:luciferin sulfotransferase-like isoform X2 [Toxorhynchites rutilus septentrionalis]|uniref:luciferin sulfotransferase-like isoform X2 n=1 Tax=Toxorhynchites rutilus septentrionalis TaxID=329112 RepID=UPI0024789288|nr:luciferin sulfotransferase-like isoform X2 [Toxorhynchites rutilus septentrionalis]
MFSCQPVIADWSVGVKLEDLSEHPFTDGNQWEPKPCVLPERYMDLAERIRNFQVLEDDVWIVTFPKCGTTWTQEMVWLIDHDLDYHTARTINLNDRSVFLELFSTFDRTEDTITAAENLPRPRHIKSHLPVALLPKQLWTVKPKIVYVSRNPKDVAASYLHHYRGFANYRGTKEEFFERLLADEIEYCPQVAHVLEFWRIKDHPNILFLAYEQMKRDLRKVLPTVCDFLGKQFSNKQLDQLAKHLSFEEMKKNPATNNVELVQTRMKREGREGESFEFMRKGQIGDYKNELSSSFIDRFDEFIERELRGSDFRFDC